MTKKVGFQSIIDPRYLQGAFYRQSHGDIDAEFKVQQLGNLIRVNRSAINLFEGSVADIGCGTGKTTFLLHLLLAELFETPIRIDGYDIHPYVSQIAEKSDVRFFWGDFCLLPHEGIYDIGFLFDVIEHVPDPISFIREVSKSCRVLAFHIPLDDSLSSWLRNLQRTKITHPGHLLILDVAAAINLLAFSGLRIIDFAYSPVFKAPSGKETHFQRVMNPLREVMYRFSPSVTQKILAGVSLSVLAWTPYGLTTQP